MTDKKIDVLKHIDFDSQEGSFLLNGKGDPNCEFIGKTLKQWGSEIESELHYYEEDKIKEELEIANKKIKKQYEHLKKFSQLRKHLTNLIISGKGIQEITESLSNITKSTVIVYDDRVNLIAMFSKNSKLSDINKIDKLKGNLLKILDNKKKHEYIMLIENKTPIKIIIEKNYNITVVPIIGNLEVIGFISVIHNSKEDTEKELIETIQHSSIIYALEIIKEESMIAREQEVRGDYIYSLISNNYSDDKTIKNWAFKLGHDLIKLKYVMVLNFDNYQNLFGKNDEKEKTTYKKHLYTITKNFLASYSPISFCGILNEELIIFLPSVFNDCEDKKIITDIYNRLKNSIMQVFIDISISAGVGTRVNSIEEFKKSYDEAKETLNVMKKFTSKDKIIFYDDIGAVSLLLGSGNGDKLLKFMHKKLDVLREYEKTHNNEFIHTLESYYECNGNIQKTAREMYVSVSTVKYRLGKIKELGYELNVAQENFDMQLALKIHRFFMS